MRGNKVLVKSLNETGDKLLKEVFANEKIVDEVYSGKNKILRKGIKVTSISDNPIVFQIEFNRVWMIGIRTMGGTKAAVETILLQKGINLTDVEVT